MKVIPKIGICSVMDIFVEISILINKDASIFKINEVGNGELQY